MSNRVVHLITSACDIYVHRQGKNIVRVRITEKDSEVSNPTDFEVEGSTLHISEAFSALASVLENIEDVFQKAPN
jgi:hypothetical protein